MNRNIIKLPLLIEAPRFKLNGQIIDPRKSALVFKTGRGKALPAIPADHIPARPVDHTLREQNAKGYWMIATTHPWDAELAQVVPGAKVIAFETAEREENNTVVKP